MLKNKKIYVCADNDDWELSIPLYTDAAGVYSWGDTGIEMTSSHPLYDTLENPNDSHDCYRLKKVNNVLSIMKYVCMYYLLPSAKTLCFTSDTYAENERYV